LWKIHALRDWLWRRGAVHHENIIVAIGIKFIFGEVKEVSIFVADDITSTPPAIVISNDVTHIIGLPKAVGNWLI
jgi:hypothetical protein